MSTEFASRYPIKRSARRTCAIKVKADGTVTILAPYGMPRELIEQFVHQKADWILSAQTKIAAAKEKIKKVNQLEEDEIRYLVGDAKRLIPPRVEQFASEMGVEYNRITIRSQRTRWGSCSSKKNLNFNCLLMLAPDEVVDYVIVHELCHLREMNHSRKFWAEVERVLPDYKLSRDWLKRHGDELMAQLPEK